MMGTRKLERKVFTASPYEVSDNRRIVDIIDDNV